MADIEELIKLRIQTDKVVTTCYEALSAETLDKQNVEHLEERLSSKIYQVEGLIQARKKQELPEEVIEELYRRRSALKRIADGLAWMIFDYDTSVLNTLFKGSSPGFMAGKNGYENERTVVKALYRIDEIRYAIQCDITNALRLGDVLAINQNGEITPIEVKGTGSGRLQRQKNRSRSLLEYARTGILYNTVSGMQPLHALRVENTFTQYCSELEILADQAAIEGIATGKFDDCVVLTVINAQGEVNQEDLVEQLRPYIQDWEQVTFSSLGRHLSKDKDVLPYTRLPITVFPLRKDIGLSFVLGHLDCIIAVNKDRVAAKIREAGLSCVINQDGTATVVSLAGKTYQIMDAWDKLFIELVTLPSFVNHVSMVAEHLDSWAKAE